VCANAASKGHLDIFRYAHENGREWDGHTIMIARENKYLEVAEWAITNGCRNERQRNDFYF